MVQNVSVGCTTYESPASLSVASEATFPESAVEAVAWLCGIGEILFLGVASADLAAKRSSLSDAGTGGLADETCTVVALED